MVFYPLEKLHRLHDGYRRAFNVDGHELLLLQEENTVHLIVNRCPHQDAPLTYAGFKDGFLRCPMHGIEFSLRSGESKSGIGACLKKYSPAYEGNQIGVYL